MKANERALLAACIDTGIYSGWTRAHKHEDAPHELRIQEEIDSAIWYEIDQYFDFSTDRNLFDEVMEGLDDREAKREALYDLVKMDMFKASSKLEGIDYDKKREWVGLTKEELQDLWFKSYATDNAGETHFDRGYFATSIEAKLKEKNNG